jgi:hypothetical protein
MIDFLNPDETFSAYFGAVSGTPREACPWSMCDGKNKKKCCKKYKKAKRCKSCPKG